MAAWRWLSASELQDGTGDGQELEASPDGNLTEQVCVCAHVWVSLTRKNGQVFDVWMTGLHLQEIIIFIVLHIKLSSTSL